MARKRLIKSHLRGKSKKPRIVGSSKRKFRTGRTRLRPEVKFRNTIHEARNIRHRLNASSSVSGNDFFSVITHPPQGTGDQERIGDTLMGKKLYIRLSFFINKDQIKGSVIYRVIVFNRKIATNPGTDIVMFQLAVSRPAFNGFINYEVVNKVFYDKQFVFHENYATDDDLLRKSVNINISMKWPIVYSGGSINPKDYRNEIYMAIIGYMQQATVEAQIIGYADVNSNFYFTDA